MIVASAVTNEMTKIAPPKMVTLEIVFVLR